MSTFGGLPASAIGDLFSHVLPHFHRRGMWEATFQFNEYYFLDEVFRTDKMRVQSGNAVEWRLLFKGQGNGSARHERLYAARDEVLSEDRLRKGTAPWCYGSAEVAYEKHRLTMQQGDAELYDYLEAEYFTEFRNLCDEIEPRAVLAPSSSEAEDIYPRGLAYYLNFLDAAVTSDGEFSGQTARFGDGTTSTTVAGLSKATNAHHKNYAATYSGVVDMALVDKMRRAVRRLNFKPPRSVKEYYERRRNRWSILSDQDRADEYERLVNAGPDDRNGDLNPFNGMLTFKGIDWIGLSILNNRTYTPIYLVNWTHFFPIVHRDWFFKPDDPIRDARQRHVVRVGIDCQYQYGCDNIRHAGGVFHTVTA